MCLSFEVYQEFLNWRADLEKFSGYALGQSLHVLLLWEAQLSWQVVQWIRRCARRITSLVQECPSSSCPCIFRWWYKWDSVLCSRGLGTYVCKWRAAGFLHVVSDLSQYCKCFRLVQNVGIVCWFWHVVCPLWKCCLDCSISFDISIGDAFDLLDHLFFAVISCLVLTRRFVLILLGSSCSPFCSSGVSMVNFTDWNNEQYRKNSTATKQLWQIGQSESSLMWCLLEMLSLESCAWKAVRDIFMDGAPWIKSTTSLAKFRGVELLGLRFDGGQDHIQWSWTWAACSNWRDFADATFQIGFPQA